MINSSLENSIQEFDSIILKKNRFVLIPPKCSLISFQFSTYLLYYVEQFEFAIEEEVTCRR